VSRTATATSSSAQPVDRPDRFDGGARALFGGRGLGNASLVVGAGGGDGRRRALGRAGLRPSDAVFMEQVHGGGVARVGRADRGRGERDHRTAVPGVDALVTTDTDVALVVLTADCVPVLLVAPGGVGAVHAGRRGVQAGVVAAAVAALAAAGPPPSSMTALVGPAIGACCYEVPAGLAEEVVAEVPAARATTRWGAPALDLPAAVAGQLEQAGVGRVEDWWACTRCHAQRWFSHRATAAGVGSGRNTGVVCRRSDRSQ
jgi:YfiH family protein